MHDGAPFFGWVIVFLAGLVVAGCVGEVIARGLDWWLGDMDAPKFVARRGDGRRKN